MTDPDLLDEAYARLHTTGPEFQGWLSNHGPMAADALLRLGQGDHLPAWLDSYVRRLEEPPATRWPLDPAAWREVLGDPSRLGDWRALLEREVREQEWQAVLVRWWPRLLPGAAASAAHGLIRTGHAVRALRERESAPRRTELAHALAYWAARWQPLPVAAGAGRGGRVDTALDRLPAVAPTGGFRTRLATIAGSAPWRAAVRAHGSPAASGVPVALDALVDAALTRYAAWGRASPVMLVHAATAPRAAGLVLPSLPEDLWPETYRAAWAVTAALTSAYRPRGPFEVAPVDGRTLPDAVTGAVALGDEHAVKLVETAQESDARGNPAAAAAANRAVDWIAADP